MIKFAIFDLDGVLVDIKNIHYLSLNEALDSFNENYKISYAEHLSIYEGLKTFDKLKLLTKYKSLPIDYYDNIWQLKQKKTLEHIKKIQKNDCIIEVLKEIKYLGLQIAVASNSIRETVKQVLLTTGYMNYVDFFLSNEDVKCPKPSSEIYLSAMIKAGVSPKETIIFEDSPVGIQAAQSSGAEVFQVKNTKCINKEIIKNIKNIKNINFLKNSKWLNKNLNVVIPMAGLGSRFEKEGYTFPKPLIDVNGDPMIKAVVDNINVDANYTFIVQKQHYEKYNLYHLLNLIAKKCNIITVENVTEGAACTVLLAKDIINNENPLLLVNSDQIIEWNSYDFFYNVENSSADGTIVTFRSTHPKWSFVKLENNLVVEVAEKKPISNIATVGIYYWKKGLDFVNCAESMIRKNIRVNNEFYICPVFNESILQNKIIRTYDIEKMHGLGTPEDLKRYLEN
jgi:HAD superfamily hydrolase (TIGR01509 family)